MVQKKKLNQQSSSTFIHSTKVNNMLILLEKLLDKFIQLILLENILTEIHFTTKDYK